MTQTLDQKRAALEERSSKLKKNKLLKGVAVHIEQQGNSILLKGLAAS